MALSTYVLKNCQSFDVDTFRYARAIEDCVYSLLWSRIVINVVLNKIAFAKIPFQYREQIKKCAKELRDLHLNLWTCGRVRLFQHFFNIVFVCNLAMIWSGMSLMTQFIGVTSSDRTWKKLPGDVSLYTVKPPTRK